MEATNEDFSEESLDVTSPDMDSKDEVTDVNESQATCITCTLPEKYCQCSPCSEALFTESLYSLNTEDHPDTKHTCSLCLNSFKRKSHLVQHMQTHTDLREFVCHHCERTYKRKGDLLRHITIHTDIKDSIMEDTTEDFSEESLDVTSPDMDSKDEIKVINESQVTCITCTLPEKYCQCNPCNEELFTESLHSLNTDDRPDMKHKCSVCLNSFKRKSHLVQHMQTHTDLREFVCHHCERTYKRKGELLRHMKVHTGERPYACNYCGKSFTRSSYLHQHKRIHRDEDQEVFKSYDPHICDKCGQTFNRKADLKDHVLVHTNERPYQCEMCDKAFRRKRNLRQHEKLHTGERWFCTECDKSFLRSYDLIKHKNIHLGIRITYTCEICSKILTSRSGYNGHMKHHLSAD